MIEVDNGPTEAQEISLERGVVGHEDFGTVKDLCSGGYVFNSCYTHFGEPPEFTDSGIFGVIVTEDMPTISGPPAHEIQQMLEIIAESGSRLGNAGLCCVPVECNGNISWFYMVGMGMPIIETWGTYNDGTFGLISLEPSPSNLFVGADEEIGELMPGATTIERGDPPVDPHITLPRTVFNVTDMVPGVAYDLRVPCDEEEIVAAARPSCPITTLVPVRERIPYRFDVV